MWCFSNYNFSNAFIMPNNEDCAWFVCSHLTRTTLVQSIPEVPKQTLLHLDSQTQATDNGFPTRNNQSGNTKGVTNANVNTLYFEGQTEKSHFTSNSYCWSKKQIWPICSLSSIIRQWLSVSLYYRDVSTSEIAKDKNTHTSIQRISNVNTSTGHSVFIHLRSRHTE